MDLLQARKSTAEPEETGELCAISCASAFIFAVRSALFAFTEFPKWMPLVALGIELIMSAPP